MLFLTEKNIRSIQDPDLHDDIWYALFDGRQFLVCPEHRAAFE